MMMAHGENMNVVGPPQKQNPPRQSCSTSLVIHKLRLDIRAKIYAILQKKKSTAAPSHAKLERFSKMLDDNLWKRAKSSLKDYSDLGNLEARVQDLLDEIKKKALQQQRACPRMMNVSSSNPLDTTSMTTFTTTTPSLSNNNNNNVATLQSGNDMHCTTGGFPLTCGDSNVPGFNKTEPLGGNIQFHQQTAVANYQMVDVCTQPQLTSGFSTPLSSTGLGICRNSVPLACRPFARTSQELSSTHFLNFGSNHLYGSMALAQDTIPLHPNPMVRVDATFTSNNPNPQGMQQTQYMLHHPEITSFHSASTNNFAQVRRQHFDPGCGFHQQARDIEHQGQYPQQQLYPPQLQNQYHLPTYRTQMATGLATPVNHGPRLDKQQAINGFEPSKLQYQQNAFNGAQSSSVQTSHLSSSPSLSPHPHDQKQSAPVLVQRQSFLQNSTQISENSNGDRKHIGVNVCQINPMQPEAVHRCSSARAPVSGQTVSPRSTAERKILPAGKNTSSKQVSRDRSQELRNQIRWLLFVFHARYCRAAGDTCQSEYCLPVKNLLEHTKHCEIVDCTKRYCVQTRKLLRHHEECREKSCPLCVSVKNFRNKLNKRGAEASLKCRPKDASESVQACDKGGAEAIPVDDDLQPLVKRLKIEQPSQNTTLERDSIPVSVRGVVYKPHASMPKQERDDLQSNDCKSVKVEVMPMDIDVSDASEIPATRELEKHVAGDIHKGRDGGKSVTDDKTVCLSAQGKSKFMNDMSAPNEENVKQSKGVVDVSKTEISSLVELFTPEQVKEHVRSLRQWVGQSKTKADKNKAMGCSISANACQLCAVERLVFEPIPIYCSPCGLRIKRNALHYSVAGGKSQHYVCATCYNEARENSVSVDGTSISKARLAKKKNDEQVGEGWVQCDKCQAWQHQICALFNSRRNHGEATKYTCPNCYIQEVEQGERRPLPENAIPGAKSLPVTTLSNHIEQRLFENLKKERQERARIQGKSYEEVPGAESLSVRVVASVDKVLEVKERFRELFREEYYPSEFPYKSKVILLFQKIESVEVCLFGMFVQEFGTESGPPNQRRVYLSYLDSVKYFRPEVRTVSGEVLRTFVYHEILIGYLDYCKKRGFTSCYIWACPPLKGEDYILNCHPEIQKMPKTDKLREWYLSMLKKASEEDVVVECTNLYDKFFVQSGECRANVTGARLPYFDGDYWPGAAEDLIQQMSQEDNGTTKLNRKGLTKKVITKRALRAVGQLDLSVNASKDRLMMQKLGEIICPMKEDFIMVHLQHCCKHCCTLIVSGNRWVCNHCKNFQICDKCYEVEQKRVEKERHPIDQKAKHALFPVAIKDVPVEIDDKDDNIENEFFDTRQAFLSLCQGNNYQFDTLRRAKHSSMMILYHLHNPSAPAFATICTICQQEVENAQGWQCQVCTGYDVCNACYPKASLSHSHKLISRSSSTKTSVQRNRQANQIKLDKLTELLIHATITCRRSAQCQYQRCNWMKMLIKHCVVCKIGFRDCTHCKRFWRLIGLHAGSCKDSQCTVPKCREYKAAIRRQRQQSEKRRRAAVMEMMRKRTAEATHTS